MCRRVECITHRNGTRIYQTHREREREREKEKAIARVLVLFVWQLLESHGLEWNTHTKKNPTHREGDNDCVFPIAPFSGLLFGPAFFRLVSISSLGPLAVVPLVARVLSVPAWVGFAAAVTFAIVGNFFLCKHLACGALTSKACILVP